MRKIRIAQIGAGHDHAVPTVQTLKLQSDIYELIGYAVVPEDAENTEEIGYENHIEAYDGIPKMKVEEILNDPELDAVSIETEDRALTKYAMLAAQKGLHIHMDKPGSASGDAFDKLVDTAKEKNLVFQMGYMYRYNPEVLKLKEQIKSGKLGEIYAVEAQMNCIHVPEKRQWLGNYPGGMLYFLGCHLVDLVYSIMGEPEEVIPLSTSIGTDHVTAEDFGMAVFKYKNGVSFVKSTAVEIGGFERRQLVVCGTKGTIELKPFEWIAEARPGMYQSQITGVREALDADWHKKGTFSVSESYGRYDGMLRDFASYIHGEKENPFGYEYEKNLHKLLLKACGK